MAAWEGAKLGGKPRTEGRPEDDVQEASKEHTVTNFQAALDYAACGWPVFPTWGKKPLTSRGFKDASKDPAVIADWWEKWPSANIGIPTGAASGLLIVDIDGETGKESLRQLEHDHGPLPLTRTVITRPGHLHIWLTQPTGVKTKCSAGVLGPHLDIRGDGGYIVAPPSVHPDTRQPYVTSRNGAAAEAPEWLLALVHDDRIEPTPPFRENRSDDSIPEGRRNAVLASLAGTMRRRGMGQKSIEAALLNENAFRCHPPLSDKEVIAIAASVARYSAAAGDLLFQQLSDFGNAERLIARHGDNLRYCHMMRKWFVWDGCRWRPDEGERAREMAHETVLEFVRQAEEEFKRRNSADNEARTRFARSSLNTPRLSNALREAQPALAVAPGDLDSNPWLLNFQNGTLDLSVDSDLRPHAKAELITKVIHHDYDPEAKAPLFEAFAEHTFGKELTPFVQKALGYSLTGVTSEKVVILLTGPTDTGKSTFLALFRDLLNEYAALIEVDTLMASRRNEDNNSRADLADLRGARFAITSETEEGQRIKASKIKRITQGQGRIKTARKYENFIEFPETHKLWIDTNHKPLLRGNDDSIWNRLAPIPCENRLSKDEIDRELPAKLRREATGIMAWTVQGARRWRKENLGRPKAVVQNREEWRAKMDQLRDFIEECCVVAGERIKFEVRDAELKVSAEELFNKYKKWCEARNDYPMHWNAFSDRMEEAGYKKTKPKGKGRIYHGIRLLALGEVKEDDGVEKGS